MSSYPDDRFDDRRDDRFDDGRRDHRSLEYARSAVRVPAVLLIIVGGVCALLALISLINLPNVPAQCDEFIAEIDKNPQLQPADKQKWKDMVSQYKEMAEGGSFWVAYILMGLFGAVIVLGGVKLLSLSGSALPIVSSILAMIPCTSGCCCLLGLPAGIWALIVLNRPDVRTAIAANRSAPPPNPDDQYIP